MRLSSTIHQFFSKYLPHIKALSPLTIKAYRDCFKLFLPYAANYHGIKISSLQIAHVSVEVILDFLDSLEKQRHNSAKTRNSRLAAVSANSEGWRSVVIGGDHSVNIPCIEAFEGQEQRRAVDVEPRQ